VPCTAGSLSCEIDITQYSDTMCQTQSGAPDAEIYSLSACTTRSFNRSIKITRFLPILGACTPGQPVSNLTQNWGFSTKFCAASPTALTCTGGVCEDPAGACLLYAGSTATCPTGYTRVHDAPLYTTLSADNRSCTCTCQNSGADCTAISVWGSIAAGCKDTDFFTPIRSTGNCSQTQGPNGSIYFNGAPTAPSCSGSVVTGGTAPQPMDPHTLCCKM